MIIIHVWGKKGHGNDVFRSWSPWLKGIPPPAWKPPWHKFTLEANMAAFKYLGIKVSSRLPRLSLTHESFFPLYLGRFQNTGWLGDYVPTTGPFTAMSNFIFILLEAWVFGTKMNFVCKNAEECKLREIKKVLYFLILRGRVGGRLAVLYLFLRICDILITSFIFLCLNIIYMDPRNQFTMTCTIDPFSVKKKKRKN